MERTVIINALSEKGGSLSNTYRTILALFAMLNRKTNDFFSSFQVHLKAGINESTVHKYVAL